MHLLFLIGIGLRNLGEGPAIGSAYAVAGEPPRLPRIAFVFAMGLLVVT